MSSLGHFRRFLFEVAKHRPVTVSEKCILKSWNRFPRHFSSNIYTPEDSTPPLPEYEERKNENIDVRRARLLYQSRKRGMLENGLLLSTFADKYLNTMTEDQMDMYDKLINKPSNDWEIYYWAIGNKTTPDEYNNDIMNLLKEHAQNKDLENRTRQPDLKSTN